MREFIVTNPNLSVGKPGDIVTAEQLKMSDDKLDEFVAAGHAVEVGEIADPITWADNLSYLSIEEEEPEDDLKPITIVGTVDEDYEDFWDDEDD